MRDSARIYIRVLFIVVSGISLYLNLNYILNSNSGNESSSVSQHTSVQKSKSLKWLDEKSSKVEIEASLNLTSNTERSFVSNDNTRIQKNKFLKWFKEKSGNLYKKTVPSNVIKNDDDDDDDDDFISGMRNNENSTSNTPSDTVLNSFSDKRNGHQEEKKSESKNGKGRRLRPIESVERGSSDGSLRMPEPPAILDSSINNTSNLFVSLNSVINAPEYLLVVKNFFQTPKRTKKYTCEKWEYNVAEMTLTYLPQIMEQDQPCSYPHNEIVKKIVKSNKEVVWKGCTQKTKSCREGPHYDVERKVRVNVPPCCRDHLAEMLGNFDKILEKYNVTYFLIAGGLIGWYRNKQLVPYDGDLDLMMDGSYWNTGIWETLIKELKDTYGYHYETLETHKAKLYYSKQNGNAIDIWPYYNVLLRVPYPPYQPGDTITTIYHNVFTACSYDEMFPPLRSTISGVPVSIPRNTVTFLNRNYGVNGKWLKEKQCTRRDDGGHCSE